MHFCMISTRFDTWGLISDPRPLPQKRIFIFRHFVFSAKKWRKRRKTLDFQNVGFRQKMTKKKGMRTTTIQKHSGTFWMMSKGSSVMCNRNACFLYNFLWILYFVYCPDFSMEIINQNVPEWFWVVVVRQ